ERKQALDILAMVTPLLEGPSRAGKPAQSARLVIESQKGFSNEPLPLGISLSHASGGETVTLAGLATGTTVSAGTPLGLSGWQVPARDIGNASVHAPKDFVGIMDVAIDLRSAAATSASLAGTPKQARVNHGPRRSKIGTPSPMSTLGIRAPGAVVAT